MSSSFSNLIKSSGRFFITLLITIALLQFVYLMFWHIYGVPSLTISEFKDANLKIACAKSGWELNCWVMPLPDSPPEKHGSSKATYY